MKRLGWIDPTNAQVLCNILQSRFGTWIDAWSVSNGQPNQSVCVSIAQLPEHALDVSQWQIQNTGVGGALGIRLRTALHSALGSTLMNLPGAADMQLCGRVGEEALRALIHELVGQVGLEMNGQLQPIDQDRFLLRHGALRAIARWDVFEIELVADALWCASHIDSVDDSPRPALTARAAALRSQTVGLHAQLIVGEMELADASTLCVGEVLVVDSDAHAALQLMNGALVVAAARLVVADGQRALELH